MRPDRGQSVYPLKVAAGLVGLSPRTIRLYEESRLLEPARVGGNRERLYSEQDLQWLRCIRDMIHEEGLTVVAIRRLLDLIPCWEVRHCAADVADVCRSHQRVPGMPTAGDRSQESGVRRTTEATADGAAAEVEIRLFYGVQELGSVLECSRCIAAERVARRVALKYPGQVAVRKFDVVSDEAATVGVVMPPTIMVDKELVAMGRGVSEEKLERVIERHLSARETA
jgi:DNA-binding transcriptional MerR regulator